MSRALSYLIVHLVLAVLVAACAAPTALILAGAVGGGAIGVAPEATFGLVEGLLCRPEDDLVYSSVRRSYHQPGESEPHLECVGPTGEGQDVLVRGIAAVLSLAFAASFTAVYFALLIPLSIAGMIVTHLVSKEDAPVDPSQPE